MKSNTAEKTAKILLSIKAVALSPKKPFRYTSGMLSPIYTDIRLINSFPKERNILAGYYAELIKEEIGLKNVDVVSGTATASIAMAAWIADKLKLPMIYARPQKKAHGKGKQVEGILKKKDKVVVVEDLISTGGSSLANASACKELGAFAKHVVAAFRYPTKSIDDDFKKAKVKLHALCTFDVLVKVAAETGYIKKEEEQMVKEWGKDTWGWAKKMGVDKAYE